MTPEQLAELDKRLDLALKSRELSASDALWLRTDVKALRDDVRRLRAWLERIEWDAQECEECSCDLPARQALDGEPASTAVGL